MRHQNTDDREILYHFAMEEDPRSALPRYQSEYPERAEDLAALADELERPIVERELDSEDYMLIDWAMDRFRKACLATPSRLVN